MQTNANMTMNARLGAADASDEHLMWLCNECETGSNKCARCDKCGQGGATNAD